MALPLPMKSRPGLYIITGANRGFGRTLALTLAEDAAPGSRFILIGRNADGLASVAAAIGESREANEIETFCVSLDLGSANFDQISVALKEAAENPLLGTYETPFGLLIHNAGTLGDFGRLSDNLTDKDVLDQHWSINMTSVLLLNAYFLKLPIVSQWWLVNVSSLCALQPFKTLAVYCSSKAARLMLFRTLAAERPDLTILSFGPGPLNTDMQSQLRQDTADPEARLMWQEMQSNLLPTAQSAMTLVRLLRRGGYATGSEHQQVDVYDVMDELLQPPTPPTPTTSLEETVD